MNLFHYTYLQKQQGQKSGRRSRLHLNPSGLAAELRCDCPVLYHLFPGIQIACPTQRQDHSGLLSGLKKTKRTHPERQVKPQTPRPGRTRQNQAHPQTDCKQYPAQNRPVSTRARANY